MTPCGKSGLPARLHEPRLRVAQRKRVTRVQSDLRRFRLPEHLRGQRKRIPRSAEKTRNESAGTGKSCELEYLRRSAETELHGRSGRYATDSRRNSAVVAAAASGLNPSRRRTAIVLRKDSRGCRRWGSQGERSSCFTVPQVSERWSRMQPAPSRCRTCPLGPARRREGEEEPSRDG